MSLMSNSGTSSQVQFHTSTFEIAADASPRKGITKYKERCDSLAKEIAEKESLIALLNHQEEMVCVVIITMCCVSARSIFSIDLCDCDLSI